MRFLCVFYAIRSGRHRSTFDATAARKLAVFWIAVFWIAVFQLESSEKLGLQSHTVETRISSGRSPALMTFESRSSRAFNPLAAI